MNRYGWLAVGTGLGLLIGIPAGFFSGVASTNFGREMIEGMVSPEQRANVKEPRTFVSKAAEFQYPGNWKQDLDDSDADPDYYTMVESPGGVAFSVYFLDGKGDVKENVHDQEEAFTQSYITKAVKTPIRKWGNYEGYGMEIKGTLLHFNRGKVTIFSHAGKNRTFTITELVYDDEMRKVQPGFDLIRRTFRLK